MILADRIEAAPDGRSLTILGEMASEEAKEWRRIAGLIDGEDDEFEAECVASAEKYEALYARAEERKAQVSK